MKRPNVNFMVDFLGFAALVLLTATGVLMRYVLRPGSGHFRTIWTLDRHEWGSIHFWIAIAFLAVLAFHLFLDWRWIMTLVRGRPREGSGARFALGTVGLMALLALAIAPFLSLVERDGAGPRPPRPHSSEVEGLESIRGFMTLGEVEEATGVPAELVLEYDEEALGALESTGEFAWSAAQGRASGTVGGELERSWKPPGERTASGS